MDNQSTTQVALVYVTVQSCFAGSGIDSVGYIITDVLILGMMPYQDWLSVFFSVGNFEGTSIKLLTASY